MPERNESTADRIIRAGLGVLLIGAAMRPFAVWRRPWLVGALSAVGAVLLLTAATGSCGIYRAVGFSTYRK
ncbi:MAG TPA: DUF2892 domain-containing protein [Anaerolineae bacterium]|nr:DUF2892 domain-containing protein [Anaerolineae bacterium]HOR00061.1 DUF2892 domain-containing protein [Anaerolineae bacterium]HPL29438.1 DUF2892 domain-containing protein [Anaerolineae bacterium]